jgi:hypothetical protein
MMGDWTLFSNHGHVLVCLARNNQARLRDVAADVGITERAVQKIVRELQIADFVRISKHGRCNHYEVNTRKSMRHDLESNCTLGKLLQLFSRSEGRKGRVASSKSRPVVKPETKQEVRVESIEEIIPKAAIPSSQPEPQAEAQPEVQPEPPEQNDAADYAADLETRGSELDEIPQADVKPESKKDSEPTDEPEPGVTLEAEEKPATGETAVPADTRQQRSLF